MACAQVEAVYRGTREALLLSALPPGHPRLRECSQDTGRVLHTQSRDTGTTVSGQVER